MSRNYNAKTNDLSDETYYDEVETIDECKPTESDNRFRNFKVESLDSGFLVQIGCQRIAVETKEKLAQLANDYILNHSEIEKKYYQGNYIVKPNF